MGLSYNPERRERRIATKLEALLQRLDAGETVALSARSWASLAASFSVVERQATGLAGDLLIVARDGRLAAVEAPDEASRAVRPLKSRGAARDFLRERLAAYDRLWDG
jgi:hypothetical protein